MKTQVGFIGLGSMGLPMAQNILKAGFPVWTYNRTKEKAAPLLEQGGQWAASPAELAAACDIVVSMVSNDDALKEIVEGTSGIMRSSKKPATRTKTMLYVTSSGALPTLLVRHSPGS